MYKHSIISNMLNIFVIVLFIICNTVAEDADIELRIAGGTVPAEDQFAFQVSVKYNTTLVCSATIVHTSWLLTVAHCLHFRVPEDVTAYVGSNNLTTGGIEYNIDRIILHENWNLLSFENDIVMLHLSRPIILIPNRAAIGILTRTPVPDGAVLTMAGWGAQTSLGPYSEQMMVIRQIRINRTECSRRGVASHTTNLCVLSPRRISVCGGDSGSPCVYQNRIVGVASYAICGTGLPDVFTDVTQYVDWVQNIIRKYDRSSI